MDLPMHEVFLGEHTHKRRNVGMTLRYSRGTHSVGREVEDGRGSGGNYRKDEEFPGMRAGKKSPHHRE